MPEVIKLIDPGAPVRMDEAVWSPYFRRITHVCEEPLPVPVEIGPGWVIGGLDDQGRPFLLPAPPGFEPFAPWVYEAIEGNG